MKDGIVSFIASVAWFSSGLILFDLVFLLLIIMFIVTIYLNKLNKEQKRFMNIIKMTPSDIIEKVIDIQEKMIKESRIID